MDTLFRKNSNGGVNGFPSGRFYDISDPEVTSYVDSGGVIESEFTREEAVLRALSTLETHKEKALRSGVAVGETWFYTGGSRTSLNLYYRDIAYGSSLPDDAYLLDDGSGVFTETMDGTVVQLTLGMAKDIAAKEARLISEIARIAGEHSHSIMASEAPMSYNSSVGWPIGYGG